LIINNKKDWHLFGGGSSMLKNYFRVAVRNLLRNKAFSVLNISGLALGMASATLIGLWILHELSYDHYYPKQARLYELMTNHEADGKISSGIQTPEIMPPTIKREVPEVEQVARLNWPGPALFIVNDKSIKASGGCADPEFLTMFDFPFVEGDRTTALNDPYSVVLTASMAKRLFGNDNPVGRTVKIDNELTWTVTGVMKDLPDNTQFKFDWLNSYHFKEVKHYIDSDWTDVGNKAFVLLKPHADPVRVNARLKPMIPTYSHGYNVTTAFIYPMDRMRLYSEFENGKPVGGRITTVRTFGLIAVLILLIACINFMNLSTARSDKRAKEVGIRKVVGAGRPSLIFQFLGESLLIALIGGILALILVQLSLPAFNQLTGKELSIAYGSIYFWLCAAAFICFTGLLAGSYPAFYLSSFRPISVLKAVFRHVNALVTPRKVLVVVQFTVAIVLIISTMVILQQVKYAQGRSTGYDQRNLIYVMLEGDLYTHYEAVRSSLLNSGAVTAVSGSGSPITQTWSSGSSLSWEGMTANTHITFMRASSDGNIVKAAGLTLVQGRDIDIRQYPADSTACLINEAALKAAGFKNPIGQLIFDDPLHWHVVGVIKDFILNSPYEPIKPLIIKGPRYGIGVFHMKLNSDRPTAQNLATIEKILKTYNPAFPFEYHFVDQEYATYFANEQLTEKLAALFAGLIIIISCMGLFGLATYTAETRIKEIGIRKVLGATASRITVLLSTSFVKLVLVSFIVATPIAWYVMDRWLASFPYRTPVSIWLFVAAGAGAILIALFTVGFQAIRAAVANPVKSLRAE
jgi:putative ABC transport system permease protein